MELKDLWKEEAEFLKKWDLLEKQCEYKRSEINKKIMSTLNKESKKKGRPLTSEESLKIKQPFIPETKKIKKEFEEGIKKLAQKYPEVKIDKTLILWKDIWGK